MSGILAVIVVLNLMGLDFLIRCLESVNKTCHRTAHNARSLLHRVTVAHGVHILDAEDHVVRHAFQQVRLVFQSKVRVCITTVDHQRVQSPIYFLAVSGLESKHKPLRLSFSDTQLNFHSKVVFGLVVQTCGCGD